MLSDAQIDRYCRQIVLPEIGGGGQERLLASSVAILGQGDAVVVCASYLAGAGLGALWLSAPSEPPQGAATTLAGDRAAEDLAGILGERNPDCRVSIGTPASPALTVAVAAALPERLVGPLVAGGASSTRAVSAHVPAGRPCADCLRAFFAAERCTRSTALVGTLLALLALRALLGLAGSTASAVRVDLGRGTAEPMTLPTRSGCPTCGEAA